MTTWKLPRPEDVDLDQANSSHVRHTWEQKPCETCGYVRRVKVSLWRHLKDAGPTWSRNCAACELEAGACHHDVRAAAMRRQAAAVRERQKKTHKTKGADR